MGLLDKIFEKFKSVDDTSSQRSETVQGDASLDNVPGVKSDGTASYDKNTENAVSDDVPEVEDIVLASTARVVEEEEFGDGDSRFYR